MTKQAFLIAAALLAATAAAAQDDTDTHRRTVHHPASTPVITPPPAPAPAPVPVVPPKANALTQSAATANPLLVLQQFTLTDLQAALADAQAQTPPDTVAANCYTALITLMNNPIANPIPSQAGAFIIFQKARDLQNALATLNSNNGPLTPVEVGCAPLVISVQNTLIQVGVLTGAVVATGGVPLAPLGAKPSFQLLQQSRDAAQAPQKPAQKGEE